MPLPAPSTSQLELPLASEPAPRPAPRSESDLLQVFRGLGLSQVQRLSLHRNRTVMVSLTPRGALRLHAGYAFAPLSVLEAIARFLKRGTRRADRLRARQALLTFPVEQYAPSDKPLVRRAESSAPGDAELLSRLTALHGELNRAYFEGSLEPIPIRLSGRMRRRLGELRMDRRTGRPLEIALSRRHLRRDGWAAFRDTLLHEMIHQWQGQSAQPVDHGRTFRQKAKSVGIEPRAVRGER